ncbi:LytR/AlgR family response regulator transcription factor [Mangrovibacterium sp.]|uniref:LytR/AlgR family response regulator transcription factor n=1 Tax=Mangrovibacterium sp. TaxID=1961364 RepID=UPI003566B8A0
MISTLIIDDDPMARRVLAESLEKSFGPVNIVGTAECVECGLALIHLHDPDLVFLDVEMPDGTGFDLLDKLSRWRFKLAVLSSCFEYRPIAETYAAQKFMLKPLNLQMLHHFVSGVISEYENS